VDIIIITTTTTTTTTQSDSSTASEFSRECDLVPPILISTIFSFP
jgi:hypothetical protein